MTRTALYIVAWFLSVGPAWGWPVELIVRNDTGVTCRSAPVTSGVPLKMGMARSTKRLRIVDANGKAVAAQFRALNHWPDGSIRWILCDFQVSLEPEQSATFRLEQGGETTAPSGVLAVRDGRRLVTIDTGVARFSVSKQRFTVLDRVTVRTESGEELTLVRPDDSNGILITASNGTRYRSSADRPREVVIEERGPMRVSVRVRGTLGARTGNSVSGTPLSYTARIHAYRGHSYVKLQFVLHNGDRRFEKPYAEWEVTKGRLGKLRAHEFSSLALVLKTEIRPTRYLFGGDRIHEGSFRGRWVELYQDSSGTGHWGPAPGWPTTFRGYKLFRGPNEELASGNHALGWGVLHDQRAGAMIAMRHFWQNFPKGTVLAANGRMGLELFPRRWSEPHRFFGGMNKTHELLLHFFSGADEQSERENADLARTFERPLRATVSPSWYRDTLALGYISTQDDRFTNYDRSAANIAQGIARVRRERDLFGWMHFGDDYRNSGKQQKRKLWAHNEFDLAYSMLLAYVRDPEHDVRFFETGESIMRHVSDIVTYHTVKDKPWYNGSQHQHGGFDTASGFDHHGTPGHSHFWIQNMTVYYCLTGDEHIRDVFERCAANCRTVWTGPEPGSWDGREWEARDKGWSLCALVEAYEATGDSQWLDVIRANIIPYLARHQHPKGCILEENDENNLAKPWQLGYLTEGLGRYALNQRLRSQPDRSAETILHRLNDFLKHEAEGGKVYEWYTHGRHVRDWNFSMPLANGFAYEYLLTGEDRYRKWAIEAIEPLLKRRWSYSARDKIAQKSSALGLRFGQVAMYVLQVGRPIPDRLQK